MSASGPGIGDSKNLLRSGGALCGISLYNSAARGSNTRVSIRLPLCDTRMPSGFFTPLRFASAVMGVAATRRSK